MYSCESVKGDHCPMSKTMHCMKKIKKISVSEETFLKQIENKKKIFLKIWSSDFTDCRFSTTASTFNKRKEQVDRDGQEEG